MAPPLGPTASGAVEEAAQPLAEDEATVVQGGALRPKSKRNKFHLNVSTMHLIHPERRRGGSSASPSPKLRGDGGIGSQFAISEFLREYGSRDYGVNYSVPCAGVGDVAAREHFWGGARGRGGYGTPCGRRGRAAEEEGEEERGEEGEGAF